MGQVQSKIQQTHAPGNTKGKGKRIECKTLVGAQGTSVVQLGAFLQTIRGLRQLCNARACIRTHNTHATTTAHTHNTDTEEGGGDAADSSLPHDIPMVLTAPTRWSLQR